MQNSLSTWNGEYAQLPVGDRRPRPRVGGFSSHSARRSRPLIPVRSRTITRLLWLANWNVHDSSLVPASRVSLRFGKQPGTSIFNEVSV